MWIYDISTMKVLHTIRDIPPNPDGLCALSSRDESSFLAYPGSKITGEIQVFDTVKLVS
jgi:autophagy-related protein 18